jgi:hypothetical protein
MTDNMGNNKEESVFVLIVLFFLKSHTFLFPFCFFYIISLSLSSFEWESVGIFLSSLTP